MCRLRLGETTAALGRPSRRKPSCSEGQRRPGARAGGAGEKAQRGGGEGKGAGKGAREGARAGARARARQGTGPGKGAQGAPKPLKQPPLQSDLGQEKEQISRSAAIPKQRQRQREGAGAQAQQVWLPPLSQSSVNPQYLCERRSDVPLFLNQEQGPGEEAQQGAFRQKTALPQPRAEEVSQLGAQISPPPQPGQGQGEGSESGQRQGQRQRAVIKRQR